MSAAMEIGLMPPVAEGDPRPMKAISATRPRLCPYFLSPPTPSD